MALKATIFKAQIQLTDMDRHVYDTLNLTIARHPSENDERMMVRVLAFILNSHEQLQMTKGLSTDDEPDIWQLNLSGEIDLWIELGQPDEKRIKKAFGRTKAVKIYSFGDGVVEQWWQKQQSKLMRFDALEVVSLSKAQSESLATLAKRTMNLNCTIQDGEIWLSDEQNSVTVQPNTLKAI